NTKQAGPLLGVILALAGLWFITMAVSQSTSGIGIFICILLACCGYAVFYLKNTEKKRLTEKVALRVESHISALVRRRAQLLNRDAYGTTQTDRWNKEIV